MSQSERDSGSESPASGRMEESSTSRSPSQQMGDSSSSSTKREPALNPTGESTSRAIVEIPTPESRLVRSISFDNFQSVTVPPPIPPVFEGRVSQHGDIQF